MTSDTTHSPTARRLLAAILVSGFLTTLGVGLFSFTLPLASLDEKVGGAWLGSGFAGYFLIRLLAAPLAGVWSDKVGARLPLLTALGVGVCAPLVYFLHPCLWVLYGVQFALGAVSGVVRPVGMAVLGGVAGRSTLSRWFALHALLFNLAMFIGPLAGGGLYLGRRIEPVLIGLCACMAVALLVVVTWLPGGVHKRDVAENPRLNPTGNAGAQCLLVVLLAVGGRTLGIGLIAAFYPIYLTLTLGRSGLVVGLLYAVPSLAVCLGLSLVGRLFRRSSHTALSLLGMTVSAAALFALGASGEPWQLAFFGTVMGLGTAMSAPASMALVAELSPRQGVGFGLAQAASGLGFVLGPLLGGVVVQQVHNVGIVFQFAAVIGALACTPLLAWILVDRLHYGRRVALVGALACALLLVGAGGLMFQSRSQDAAQQASGLYRFTDVAMGTVVNLTLAANSRAAADVAARHCIAMMREVQADLDFRNPEGSVGRINRAAGRGWVEPTPRAMALIRRAVEFGRVSNGVFDPTIGALTTSPLYYALDDAIARAKKGLVDYRLVHFEGPAGDSPGRIRLGREGMALDLGGIAKGTIIDAAVRLLRSSGIAAGIVEAGGDFYCFGPRDWTVGIRHPRSDSVFRTVTVREKGVCGSGDYQQYVVQEHGGRSELRHHIINPADMEPAESSTGVTVIADSAETADALATSLFIMGADRGVPFVRDHFPGVSAIWFGPDLSVVMTEGFPQ
jgi:thiamine biosynthesis lipoprotein